MSERLYRNHRGGTVPKALRCLIMTMLALLASAAIGAASAAADGNIVAMKGGDRSASNSVSGSTNYASPLAGAGFEYTTGNPTLPATTWTAFPSLTNASGLATATVPAGTYYVREKTPAADFDDFGPVTSLSYNGAQPYVARVTVQNNSTTYAFPHTNTNSNPSNWTPTNGPSGSNNGSPFVDVRNNGSLPAGCGTNILLVLDRSGSIDPYRDQYEAAAKQFIASLNGTPTQIGIISFNASVNSYQPAQGDNDFYQSPLSLANAGSAATLNSTIEDIYDDPDGLTNWDGVLRAASQAKSFSADATTGQTANPDMVVFITDGNPTTSQASTSSSNADLINLTSGIASANLVKNQAARPGGKVKMLAIGVGTGVTIDNLKVVSGPEEGVDGDYAAPTIPELSAFLSELAASQCGARVYVRKHVTGQSGNQANWLYTATDPRPGKTPTYLDNNRATHSSGNPPVIETGAFFSQLPSTPTTVNVDEDATGQPMSNFELTSVDCRYGSYTGSPVSGGVKNGLQFSLPVSRGDSVYCTYTNAPKTTLSVSKTPNDLQVNAGEDVEFTIQVTNTGSNQATGVTLTDPLPTPGVGGWTISSQPGGNPCQITAGTLNCSFGNLNSGQSVTVKVKTGTSFAACGVYDNPSAQAGASNAPSVTDGGKVTCRKPDLSVSKTGNGTIDAGQDASFTITVANAGPGTAKSVTLSDPLPGGTAGPWVIISQPPGNPCTITGGNLTCQFGDLAAGQQAQVVVKAPTSDAACAVYDNLATTGAANAPSTEDGATVTCRKPSLGTLKTAVQASISAGDDAEFEITVSNAGPGVATGVTLSDPLPSGVAGPWTIVSQPAGNPCSIAAGTLSCDFGDLAAGASRTVKVKAPTDFQSCSELVNLATASADNAPDASDGATIACNRPNLAVSKQGNGPVDAGEAVSFSVTTTNNGPGIARAVKLSDPLPAGTAGAWSITSQPAGDPCQITAGQLDCEFGDLAAGQSRTVTVQAATDAEHCGQYDNTATATAGNSPQATGDAQVLCRKPDLSVVKTGNGPVDAGQDLEFSITVANGGPGSAKEVSLTDSMPGGTAGPWTIASQPAGDPCQITAGTLSCDFGDMDADASFTVKVSAPTSAADCTGYDNTADVSADNVATISDSASIECRKPSLSLAKSGNGPVDAGDDVTFSLTLSNAGPGTATAAGLSDPLPSGVAGDWSITSQPAGDPCQIAAGQLDCDFGDLAAGQSRTVTVSAATDFEHCAKLDNQATGTASNHTAVSAQASIECLKPDLEIAKTGNGPVDAGSDVEFTIKVSNGGPGKAKSVTLNDPLPTGVAGAWSIASQPAGNPCQVAADLLSCDFGDLDAGASVEVKVKAPTTHDACKLFENTATAGGEGLPSVEGSASVACQKPDLGTLKTAVQASISAGDTAQFEVTVSNAGPGTAKAVTMSDPLPTGVSGEWTIVTQPAGDPCQITGGTLSCDFGDLASGQSRTVKVEAPTDFESCSELVNVATASASNAPDASDDATIACNRPDLSLAKEGNGTVNAGDDVSFSLTLSNAGPGTAKSAALSDALPAGVAGAWSIASQPAGDPCQIAAGQLDCDFGDLAAGQSRTVTVSAATDFAHCAKLDNQASGSASNHPEVSATASVTCQKPSLKISKNGNGPINTGEDIQFGVAVSNAGPGVAKAVVMTDTLPSGTAGPWTVVSQTGGSCQIAAGVLSCDFGELKAGATASVVVKAPTDAANCGAYDNTASFTAGNAPSGSAQATVECLQPGLAVTKTGNGPVNAGRNVAFTITVSNSGSGTARDVKLEDPLPSGTAGGWRIVAEPGAGTCQIAGRTLSCEFGDLAAGGSVSVRVAAKTSDRKCARYRNTARVTAANFDPIEASATVRCKAPAPRLRLKKTANRKRVFPGDTVRYKIWVRNAQKGSVARNLRVCDRLPGQMTVASRGKGSFFDRGRLCWRIGKLGYSKRWRTFTYVARVNENVRAGMRLKNVVTMGRLRATKTVVVRAPEVSPARRVTPVTG